MAAIYVSLIEKGIKTIDEVPVRWKNEVWQRINDPEAL